LLSLESQIQALRPTLLKTARRFALRHDAEDLVQEAVVRALERRAALQPDTNLRAWMKPVLRNLAIDQGRRTRRLRPLDESSVPLCPVEPETPSWAAFDRGHVERALGQCSPELRTAFELHYWHCLPLDEIAGRLGIPRATVGTRLHRARLRIRRVLEDGVAVAEA